VSDPQLGRAVAVGQLVAHGCVADEGVGVVEGPAVAGDLRADLVDALRRCADGGVGIMLDRRRAPDLRVEGPPLAPVRLVALAFELGATRAGGRCDPLRVGQLFLGAC
jgi:hypothetical protein